MAYKRIKTEHAGAKNGGGAWMTRAEAKKNAKRRRRQIDKRDAAEEQDHERSHAGTRKSRPTGSAEAPKDPWTDFGPPPGDFDPELVAAQSGEIEIDDGNPLARMPCNHDMLMTVATGRRDRIQSNGRPRFDLTGDEIKRSTRTAMRLADASKPQAEDRRR